MHRENIDALEQKYAPKKDNESPNENYKEPNIENDVTTPVEVSYHKAGKTIKSLKNKNEPLVYTKLDPPPRMNTYMTNKFIMDEKKNQKVKSNKPENQKSYKEKFEEYLIDKE